MEVTFIHNIGKILIRRKQNDIITKNPSNAVEVEPIVNVSSEKEEEGRNRPNHRRTINKKERGSLSENDNKKEREKMTEKNGGRRRRWKGKTEGE